MNCDECGQRPASISYAEMVDGELRAWRLCGECARLRGIGTGLSSFAGPLVNMLMGLLEDSGVGGIGAGEPAKTCPQCGLSYAEFRHTGRLGCTGCYESFNEELLPLLRRIHGSTEHIGRFPPGHADEVESRAELRRLRAELARAVRCEDYERAAELRDSIHAKERETSETGDVDV